MADIREAQFPDHTDVVLTILREYAADLEIDLCFQNFEAELAALPGKYAAPKGRLLLAWADGKVLGCVAMRPLEPGICEMKRLFVGPTARGQQLGRQLATSICAIAKDAGYESMRLDTLSTMHAALDLYTSLGFRPIAPYVFNPIEGARYLQLDLSTWQLA